MAGEPRKLQIPLKNSRDDEVIEINLLDLPDGDDILSILRDEHARLSVWIQTAVEYYKKEKFEVFTRILELSGQEANLDYPGFEKDQVRALDTLAAYYVKTGHRLRGEKDKKKDLFTKATLLYTTADKIIMYDLTHLLGRALFCLLEGNKMDQADQQFTFVLQGSGSDSDNIPAMLGKACIAFQKKDYTQALFFYKKALRKNPLCPANVRVGLGHCYVKLNKMDYARQCFDRALQLEPTNVAALCATSIMDSNTMTEEGVKNGITALYSAYNLEPDNPIVLNHLANHFFYKGELAKVERLAWHAYQYADVESIRAEGSFQLARAFHQSGSYEKAFRYYYQSTQLASPNFILPFYGLGQMYIQRKEYANAITCFEKILEKFPSNSETLKILGSLYAHAKDDPKKGTDYKAKARQHLQKYNETNEGDIEVLVDLAQLFEHTDSAKSMSYYEKVCELLVSEEMEVPPEILNNMGSLALGQGNYEKARQLYHKAMERLAEENGDDIEAFRVTIMYNQARAAELLCLFDTAETLYKEVYNKDPHYLDSVLRLGCIARDRGQIFESSVLFKECMGINQTADAWTLIGMLHMDKQEWQPAQKKFEHILKMQEGKNDTYSMVALGNIWLETLFNPNRNKEKDKVHQDRAIQWYSKALKVQPKNMWAANGIGCVLAMKKITQEAREIFSMVREATADFLDVWINIAHIYMEQGQYVSAVQMYLNAMKKFGKDADSQLLLYLARAYHRTGKLMECREALEKATLADPENLVVKFNHALTLQRQATQTMKDEKATYEVVEGAISDLKTAQRIFEYIMSLREEARSNGISYTFTETQSRACADLLKQAQIYLERARQQDEEERALKARQEEERMAIKRKAEEAEREKMESSRRQMEDLKQTRQLYIQMTKDILKLPEIRDDDRKSRGGGGGRGRKRREDGEEFVNDSSDMGDWERGEGGEGGGGGERRKKKEGSSRKRRDKERGGSGSDGERRKKKKKMREEEPKLSAKQSAKIKSRAFISDDESSGDDKPMGEAMATQIRSGTPPPTTNFSSSPTDSDEEEDRRERKKKGKGKKGRAREKTPSEQSGSGSDSDAGRRQKTPSDNGDSDNEDSSPTKGRARVLSSSEESD